MTACKNESVGVAVVTYQAEQHIEKCLTPWLRSPLKPRVLVVDSSSTDATAEKARALGAEVVVIPKEEFNHGLTREKARCLLGTSIVVFLTQDAYAVDEGVLERLINPLVKKQASVAYARQLPREGANLLEAFPREFNYPNDSHIRGWEDRETFGTYTCFCSNSCAAYLNGALDEVGGFAHVLLGEDTLSTAQLLKRGHRVAYVAEAHVKHSHRYGLSEEFRRHFDTGLYRKRHRQLLSEFGSDDRRGVVYTRKLLKRLGKEKPALIPYAVLQTAVKWGGYRLGRLSVKSPSWFKKLCSSQRFYW